MHRPLLSFFTLIMLALACIMTPWGSLDDAQARTHAKQALVSDRDGEIRKLLVHLADYDGIPTIYGLARSLDPAAKLAIFVPNAELYGVTNKLMASWKLPNAKQVKVYNVGRDFSFWIRDDFVVARSASGKVRILLPRRLKGAPLPASIRVLQIKGLVDEVKQTDIEFDGGNVIVTNEKVWVGENLIRRNFREPFKSEEDLRKHIERVFGRKLVVVGHPGANVPFGHIDMFVTPFMDKTVLVGSPALGVRHLRDSENALNKPYARVFYNEKNMPLSPSIKEVMFTAPGFLERIREEVSEDRGRDVTLMELMVRNSSSALQQAYDQIAKNIESQGYRVVRLPILANAGSEAPFITYNNMLLETSGSGRYAYMPSYNLSRLDQAARQIVEKETQFKVKAIDVQNIAFLDGTIRCITQVLARK